MANLIESKRHYKKSEYKPSEGDLRVWNSINAPSSMDYYKVESPREGQLLIAMLAEEQLERSDVQDNAFGLDVFEGGEWTEWFDEDGYDIDHAELPEESVK